jgi:hypothetical protein
MADSLNKTPSPPDQLSVFLLSHLRVIETTLMLLWNDHPNREKLKADAKFYIEALSAFDLNANMSETELQIRRETRETAFDAIFHELPQRSQSADGHKG